MYVTPSPSKETLSFPFQNSAAHTVSYVRCSVSHSLRDYLMTLGSAHREGVETKP